MWRFGREDALVLAATNALHSGHSTIAENESRQLERGGTRYYLLTTVPATATAPAFSILQVESLNTTGIII